MLSWSVLPDYRYALPVDEVHGVLRHDLGFKGLVLPDSLTAGAVSAAGFGLAKAAVRGLVVGEDMVLFGASRDRLSAATSTVVHAVVSAVADGTLRRQRLTGHPGCGCGADQPLPATG